MKIDTTSGVVNFPEVTIGPQIKRQEFLRTAFGSRATVGVVNQDWVTLEISPEPGIHGALTYKNDQLVRLMISMQLPPGEDKPWDRATEMRRLALHDVWLRSELGNPPYKYAWGSILSWFDERNLSSDIHILFGEWPIEETWWQRIEKERAESMHKKS